MHVKEDAEQRDFLYPAFQRWKTEDHQQLSPKHTCKTLQKPLRYAQAQERRYPLQRGMSGLKTEDKSREQHCEKLMELLLLNCPDVSPCSYLVMERNKLFGPEYGNAQVFCLVDPKHSSSQCWDRAVSVLLRSHGEWTVHIIHSATCIQSDLHTLQRFFREWDMQKCSKFMYEVQTSLLRLLVLLEVCTSRLWGNKEI